MVKPQHSTPRQPVQRFSHYATIPFALFITLSITLMALFILAIIVKHRRDPAFPLAIAAIPAFYALVLACFARFWSNLHPTLIVSETYLRVSRLFALTLQIPWSGVQRIEDIRRISMPYGFRLRRFALHWRGGIIRFGTAYPHFPTLIAYLNQASLTHRIPLTLRDYTPAALRDALAAAPTPAARTAIEQNGAIHPIPSLDPAVNAESLWRFALTGWRRPKWPPGSQAAKVGARRDSGGRW